MQVSDKEIVNKVQHKIDFKTKPLGALGQLEEIALKIATIQQTLSPELTNPHLVVFAADHGIAKSGVSKYPAEVTPQMVLNFVYGGAAINVFCKQNGLNLKVVDAGVNFDFEENLPIIQQKIGYGTKNFLTESAMTMDELEQCLVKGRALVNQISAENCNVIGFGEMGIGNTSAASVLMSKICQLPINECVGRGTGVDDEGLKHKISILTEAINFHKNINTPLEVLSTFGGFEIAQMVGAMLQAAENKMLIMVDGFIATSAFLVAHAIEPNVLDYAVACHQSDESGHKKMLNYLNIKPILQLNLRLGEGTGCALAYPLIQSAVNFLNEMASFESAGVSNSVSS
jgi:nicotinate-nucleotide--dimethylbenzimidazole phosphoribosyltransferase